MKIFILGFLLNNCLFAKDITDYSAKIEDLEANIKKSYIKDSFVEDINSTTNKQSFSPKKGSYRTELCKQYEKLIKKEQHNKKINYYIKKEIIKNYCL